MVGLQRDICWYFYQPKLNSDITASYKFNFNLPYLPFFIRLDFITTDRGVASSSRLNDILRVINEFSITQWTVVIME